MALPDAPPSLPPRRPLCQNAAMSSRRRHTHSLAALIAIGVLILAPSCAKEPQQPDETTLFAASSLRDLIADLAPLFEAAPSGRGIESSFAGSQTLAHQISAGAHIDLFISADAHVASGLMPAPRETRPWLRNTLVLIAPADSPATLASLTETNGVIAIGAESVPVGRYTRIALRAMGVWGTVEPRTAQFTHVRAVLEQVAGGAADLGVVYSTDAATAASGGRVRIVAELPMPPHADPIGYVLAIYTDAGSNFADWLQTSDVVAHTARRHGFLTDAAPTPSPRQPESP